MLRDDGVLENFDNLFLLLHSIPVGIMLMDSNYHVKFANTKMVEIFELSKQSDYTKELEEFIQCRNFSGGYGICKKTKNCQICSLLKHSIKNININTITKDSVQIIVGNERLAKKKELIVTSAPFQFGGQNYVMVLIEDLADIYPSRQQLNDSDSIGGILGHNPKIVDLRTKIEKIAQTNLPVIIYGESGCGKELVARSIHKQGGGKNRPFIAVNCGAIPDSLLESELFGHVKGAFSGAFQDRRGRFSLADGGTLFLDEIGDISPAMQVKLLRVIQDQTFERLGDDKSLHVNVRIICATHRDLQSEIEQGHFRQDLYYRLNVFPLKVPPLRERIDDISYIVTPLLKSYANLYYHNEIILSDDALAAMSAYHWPGNIRELENVLKYAIVNSPSKVIQIQHLPVHIAEYGLKNTRRTRARKLSRDRVIAILDRYHWNKKLAARELGVSRSTLYRFLDFMGSENEQKDH